MAAVTLEMVAKTAGVSTATVSRIINGTGKVSARRRKQVMDAIEKLGYRPNMVAQSLARGQSMNVGVLTQDISSPFFSQIHKGIEQGFQGSHYHPIFVSEEWRDDREHAALEVLLNRRVDALIVLGGYIEDEVLRKVNAATPIVIVGRQITGLEQQCLQVNNHRGGYLATRHLLALGHRHIAHLAGPDTHYDAVDRLSGYMEALQEARVPLNRQLVVDGEFSEEGGMRATERLLSQGIPFTAIFAANDQSALGAQLVLQKKGLKIPQDISVVGYDDLAGSAFSYPPLTTIRQPSLKLGMAAAHQVLALLEGHPYRPPTFSCELVVRESSGPAPGVKIEVEPLVPSEPSAKSQGVQKRRRATGKNSSSG
ncbi:LacI family DNA-binding transcriptional regulator [Deinococcus cellulosilyticus]|uniref:LacI family transcriptional regulator n=1 Tax=Deinococcus cellulosilyticus (strain DSM 18568 / NBRC 106333 / KACC 11606 / 5516J-15) TaxID=1223518 RepID=A0A511MZE6_DEIC1|nr:substrate-binding domain-containing protein [Deinococcus cellulosilyticus]GEM45701.1 LacI family transcriptional regulator [Deinococcus cellulosilyticus NBRC 106333 = KACC 11606]